MTENPHWKWLYEFAYYEKLTNGPDPHITSTVDICRDLPVKEQVWRTLCYVGPYNVPSGEAIWSHWDHERYEREADKLPEWLEKNWAGI